jgi:uncharacterized protein (DUF608 family)
MDNSKSKNNAKKKKSTFYICFQKFVTDRLKHQDIDGDGLVDNGGFADQTYDAWTVVGARCFCFRD